VAEWESKFLTFMSDQKSEIRKELAEKKDLDDALTAKIRAAIDEFNTQFVGVTETATVTA
jgi:F0F1-type ATP synthase alpha subunit